MDMKENNDFFIENSNFEDRMSDFHDKLKKHLSNEYLFLSEKKDNLENEILQLKLEKSQRDKRLFSNVEKKDVRKYFSPLNLAEIDEEQKDEKEKQLTENISRIDEEVKLLESRMLEIRDFLLDIENMLNRREEEPVNTSSSFQESERDEQEDFFSKYEIKESLLDNLQNLEKYLQERYDNFEMLFEFEDKTVACDKKVIENIMRQLLYNITASIEDYNVSIVLIEGKKENNCINLILNYTCENVQVDTVKIIYNIEMI